MLRLGIEKYDYKAAFYLSEEEKDWAKQETIQFDKPILAICTKSKEPVKNWPEANWLELIQNLKAKFSIIQLGDEQGTHLQNASIDMPGNYRCGNLPPSLSYASYFIGPDSLLMHIANGLNIPSTIIFGGSRPVNCFGYADNINLSITLDCSPCWIHHGYDECQNDLKCLNQISVSQVLKSFNPDIAINSYE